MPLEDLNHDSMPDAGQGATAESVDRVQPVARRGIIDDFTLPSRLEAKLKRRRSRGRDRSGLDVDWSEA